MKSPKKEIQACMGSAHMKQADIDAIKCGDVLVLDSLATDPIKLMINDELFAIATALVYEDSVAIRIVKILRRGQSLKKDAS